MKTKNAADVFMGYAHINDVKGNEIASKMGITIEELKSKLEAELDTDNFDELASVVDELACKKITSKRGSIANRKSIDECMLERYKPYCKHNGDIIRYMVSHGVCLTDIKRYFKNQRPVDLMKKQVLTQEQAQAVLQAIDAITKNKEEPMYDIWGKPVVKNQDVRDYIREKGLNIGNVEFHLNYYGKKTRFHELMKKDLTEDERKELLMLIDTAIREKQGRKG